MLMYQQFIGRINALSLLGDVGDVDSINDRLSIRIHSRRFVLQTRRRSGGTYVLILQRKDIKAGEGIGIYPFLTSAMTCLILGMA